MPRKLTLDPDRLAVETFAAGRAAPAPARGTVRAHETSGATCGVGCYPTFTCPTVEQLTCHASCDGSC